MYEHELLSPENQTQSDNELFPPTHRAASSQRPERYHHKRILCHVVAPTRCPPDSNADYRPDSQGNRALKGGVIPRSAIDLGVPVALPLLFRQWFHGFTQALLPR